MFLPIIYIYLLQKITIEILIHLEPKSTIIIQIKKNVITTS